MNNDQNHQNNKGITPRNIVREMQESYLDYAMSVIVSRALPDARDGLKPVHRRILYAMHEMGLTSGAKYRKSAAIVGDSMGKYHPHGDTAIYDSLVRMAQDFSLRYPLIDGQGNFGSIDGDAAAAMRYTEARMSKICSEMLRDIEKDTVDFTDNYDATRKEPKVLPASIPQLLLNGSLGIAVGMATNIAPHNLNEIIDATIHLINKPKTTFDELAEIVKGPDFPTGGIIFNKQDIMRAYATGRGGVLIRGEAEIVEKKSGQFQIVITSIPYQVSKADLITKIASLVHEKKITGIRDVRDESDKEGLTIAIDLSRDAFPQKVLNSLYKHTDLEKVFHFNMVALVDGIQPQLLPLKALIEQFIEHRKIVTERRTKFDLARAQERTHILEGLKKALDHIDAVIQTIKKSADKEIAHARLMEKFRLSDKQAIAILEMKLQTLAGLERQKVEDELKEKQKLIAYLSSLLKDTSKMMNVIKAELAAVKEKYGDERKTKIIAKAAKSFSAEDLIPDEPVFLIMTKDGYIKRTRPEEYRAQKRGGKGISAMAMKEEDVIDTFLSLNTHDDILFFTNTGKVYKTKTYELPEGKRATKGKSIVNFLALGAQEHITSMLPIHKSKKNEVFSLVMITKNGIIKKVESSHFDDVRRSGIIALKLKKGDTLRWVRAVGKGDHIVLTTANGKAIRFKEMTLRPMGRAAAGVRAMRLGSSDALVGADAIKAKEKEGMLFVISEKGFGKKTSLGDYRVQGRGGSGIKTMKVTAKTGPLMDARVINPENEELVLISRKGQIIRIGVGDVPKLGRSTQGVRLMKIEQGDSIASVTLL